MLPVPRWRNLPLFVSSTFRDMHAERDHLVQVVFPELEERLGARRCTLEPIDLRWGVDTAALPGEEEKERAVLRVCLDEIERSRPFQIVLIGERYGWMPPRERLEAVAAAAGLRLRARALSVTALEIEAGILALTTQRPQRCFVYCRAPLPYRGMDAGDAARHSDRIAGDLAAARRLERLKARLRRRLPSRVRSYRVEWDRAQRRITGLEAFGRMVLEDLWAELEEWTRAHAPAPAQGWKERQREQVADFFAHEQRSFVGRPQTLQRLEAFALSEPSPDGAWGLCITGTPGSGKSALLARLHELIAARDIVLLAHAPGAVERGASVDALLARWVAELGEFLGEPAGELDDPPSARLDELFADRLERAAGRKRVVVLLDALDQLEPTDRGRFLGWLPRLWPENARLVATTVPGDASWAIGARSGCEVEPIPPLEREDAVEIAERICRRYHRELNPEVRDALLAREDAAGGEAFANPLWLALAVEALNALDLEDFVGAEARYPASPERQLLAMLRDTAQRMPGELSELYRYLLDEAQARHGAAARVFAGLVALGRYGWREADFERLMPRLGGGAWSELQFGLLRRSFRAHLIERGGSGRWDFAHRSAREAVLADVRSIPIGAQRAHREIAAHLESLPPEDPLRQGERMFHYVAAGDHSSAAAHLASELAPAELDAAIQVLSDSVVDARGSAEWAVSLIWSEGLDRERAAVVALKLQESLARELGRAGRTRAQAEVLEAARHFWRTAVEQGAAPARSEWQWARAARELGAVYQRLGSIAESANTYVESIDVALRAVRRAAEPPPASASEIELKPSLALPGSESADWLELIAVCHAAFGDLLLGDGELAAAQETYNRIAWLDKLQSTRERGHTDSREPLRYRADIALYLSRIAYLFLIQGMCHMAIGEFEVALSSLAHFQTLDPENHAIARERALLLGRISQGLRRERAPGAAIRTSGQAIEIMSGLVGKDASNREWQVCLGYFHLWHADAWLARGEPARALAHARRAHALIGRVAAADPAAEAWRIARQECEARLSSPELVSASPEESSAGEVAWDYDKPQVSSTSSEERRVAAMDPADLARWAERVRPGPTFGDWRGSLDRSQFAVRLAQEGPTASFPERFRALSSAGAAGDASAQYELGLAFLSGEVVERDLVAAIGWLRRAAEQGLVGAQYDLGVALAAGTGPPHYPAEAVEWWRRAAEQGHADAQYNLGVAYAAGAGIAPDAKAACEWWRKAAQQGLAEAQYNLGVQLSASGSAGDAEEAVQWYLRAAEQGVVPAMHNLGHAYLKGEGVAADAQQAVRWLTEAAGKGSAAAQHDLGAYYAAIAKPPDYAAAARWYRVAAEQGHAQAQTVLATHLLTGRGVERDPRAAIDWLQKAGRQGDTWATGLAGAVAAALQGHAIPQEIYAQLYEGADELLRGVLDAVQELASQRAQPENIDDDRQAAERGDAQAQYRLAVHLSQRQVPPDYAAAASWYEKAAEQGLVEAKYNLGYLYLQGGPGIAQDTARGIEWIRAAGNQGMAIAQYELAVFYSEGRVVQADPEAAARWYRRAADQGLAAAQHNLGHLYLEGRGVGRDPAAAIEWFRKAAKQGFAPSELALFMQGDLGAAER